MKKSKKNDNGFIPNAKTMALAKIKFAIQIIQSKFVTEKKQPNDKDMETLSRTEFEKSQKAMKEVERQAESLLADYNSGKTDAVTTRELLHSLLDTAYSLDVYAADVETEKYGHAQLDEQFTAAVVDPEKYGHLTSPSSSGSIARMFEPYDGSYEDYLYYAE